MIQHRKLLKRYLQSKNGLQFYFRDILFSDNDDAMATLIKCVCLRRIFVWYIKNKLLVQLPKGSLQGKFRTKQESTFLYEPQLLKRQ